MNTLLQNAKMNTLSQPNHVKQTVFSTDTHISIGLAKPFKHKITFKEICVTKRKGISPKYTVTMYLNNHTQDGSL